MDTSKLGLKVGLEIHQQLGRHGTKLFCSCPAEIVENTPDVVIMRNLRASAGEMGSVDVAAEAEQAKQKTYTYHAYHGQTCLLELDEEPPHPVNEEAVTTAIMVAKAFGSTILPRLQFMRKTIVDGSAVSGFQRTGLYAIGGVVPGLELKVRIQTLGLEEDSAKIVERTHTGDTFNLTRLGIPLLEISTAPDIKTPEQAKLVAAQIGMVLRSTHRVKRGLGTIRQDLNVSIHNGNRTEIKGAQDLRLIPKIIEYEAQRQQSLLDIQQELSEVHVSNVQDVTAAFKASTVSFVKQALKAGNVALAIKIAGFKGFLGRELCPGYRLGTEFADIAKTWGFGGIIHGDENLSKYGASQLEQLLDLNKSDGFIAIIGQADRSKLLLERFFTLRLQQLTQGVPQEVRKVNHDATTSYLRPVPGAARMYPETDIPIVELSSESIAAPKLLSEQVVELEQATGLSKDLVKELMVKDIDIMHFKERYQKLDFQFLSSALLEWPTEIAARLKEIQDFDAYIDPLLAEVHAGRLAKSSVKAILEELALHPVPVAELGTLAAKYQQIPDAELRDIIDDVIADNQGISLNALMGIVMEKVKGKADGKNVMAILREKHAS